MTNKFNSGDILIGSNKGYDEAFHPIILFGEHDNIFFLGTFLTHTESFKRFRNVPLKAEHFNVFKNPDKRQIYFAPKILFKKNEWGNFTKIGELNDLGLAWVFKNIPNNDKPILFEELKALMKGKIK